MSDYEVILRLTTVFLLVSFLVYKQRKRAIKRIALRKSLQRDGDVIDWYHYGLEWKLSAETSSRLHNGDIQTPQYAKGF